MKKGFSLRGLSALILVMLLLTITMVFADESKKMLGDQGDGSRSNFVHVIPMFDEESQKILPNDDPALPFSMKQTCGDCHDYETISKGWHFNSTDPNVNPGRPGQCWIYADPLTGTQIGLSYRKWPGTFSPEQIGMTKRQFVKRFARHMPGGDAGEIESDVDSEIMREMVSGMLEINCLACHSSHPGQDQAEYSDQILKENFRWAAAAASEIVNVKGKASDMPDTYDHLMPGMLEDSKLIEPTVTYRKNAFDENSKVFFDIDLKPPAQRCYYCHSNIDVDPGHNDFDKWKNDKDVHLASGLTCVDCHRNGLAHDITRSYEGEKATSSNILADKVTCKSCHMPDGNSDMPESGRLGAPTTEHKGIPLIHFDKLTCTACHSGPWPDTQSQRTRTARAHAMGTHFCDKRPNALPHIITPVFATHADGRIGPCKMFWPAYWAVIENENVTPLPIQNLRTVTGILKKTKAIRYPDWPELSEKIITKILTTLSKNGKSEAAYIGGGKLYQLDDNGKLTSTEHSAAKPYLWPMAHDIRPAAQSLGVRNCQDCHDLNAGFAFGDVEIDTPVVSARGVIERFEMADLDPLYTRAFALSFIFRPWLKVVAIICSSLTGLILLLYALKAAGCVVKALAFRDSA